MPKIIHSITIEDFRSFNQETVGLVDVTCLIGANESGKTNLLDALYLAKVGDVSKANDKQVLRNSDIRKNSPRHPKNQLPRIEFEISTDLITNVLIKRLLIENEIKTLKLIREGNELSVKFPTLKQKLRLFKNISSSPISLEILANISEKQEEKENNQDVSKNFERTDRINIPNNTFVYLPDIDEKQYKQSIETAISGGMGKILEDKEAITEITSTTLSEINNNLHLFFWSYESKYSLPDMVPIEDIKAKINELPVIKALFKLGGHNVADIPSLLEGRTDTDYENIFSTLSQNVSKQIKAKWRTNKKLEIRIIHKTDHLLINIKEPGYSIEPRYRSEGLRWFLAFVIGMLSQTDKLKNYLILIDEPALHLHPGGQKDVLDEINRLSKDNQIIYSTHSHFLIDRRYKERVRFLIKKENKGYALTDVKEPTKEDIFKDPLLRAALVYAISDVSFLNEKNILVEGVFDKKVIDTISNWLIVQSKQQKGLITINPNDTSVINCSGASEILKHAKLYKENGLICLSVYDSDKDGENANIANILQKQAEKLAIEEITNQKGTTMEDVIPESIFNTAINKWEVKDNSFNGIKIPRMRTINKALDSYLTGKGLQGDDYSNERKRLKHILEDEIIAQLVPFLGETNVNDKKLKELLSLSSAIIKKLAKLTKIK